MKEEKTLPNWIRLDNDQVVETTDTDPKGRFHPDLKWTKAAVGVQAGMVKQADGIALKSADPDFDKQMSAARDVMARYRNALRELAK